PTLEDYPGWLLVVLIWFVILGGTRFALRTLVPFRPTDFLRQHHRILDATLHHDCGLGRHVGEEQLGGPATIAQAAHFVDRGLAIALRLAAEPGFFAQAREQLLHARRTEPAPHALGVKQRRFGETQRAIRIARSVDHLGLRAQH